MASSLVKQLVLSRSGLRGLSLLPAALFLNLLLLFFFSHPATADNPIVQTIFTADPAPLVHNGRVYVYTGHDEDGSTNYNMRNWHLFSTDDMANWRHHGEVMSLSTFSWASRDAWAGQVVAGLDGRFYYYVPVTAQAGGMSIGVAVGDSPEGPFLDARGKFLVQNREIDPTVWIDDDGRPWMYWGNPNLWYAELTRNMTSLAGSPVKVSLDAASYGPSGRGSTKPSLYNEGPWVYKRGDVYYNVFAARCCPEDIHYSTASSIVGPWRYRGQVMAASGASFTNHPGVVDFVGKSYFFYHNGALPGGSGYQRSVCVEEFAYNADGTIPLLKMSAAGPAQVKRVDPFVRNEAETMAWAKGVETSVCSEGGIQLSSIDDGDYVKVKGVDFRGGGSGASLFLARVAAKGGEGVVVGKIEIRLGGSGAGDGTLVGTCAVVGTGGASSWSTVSCPVSGALGVQDLYLVFRGSSANMFNFNWWQFKA